MLATNRRLENRLSRRSPTPSHSMDILIQLPYWEPDAQRGVYTVHHPSLKENLLSSSVSIVQNICTSNGNDISNPINTPADAVYRNGP